MSQACVAFAVDTSWAATFSCVLYNRATPGDAVATGWEFYAQGSAVDATATASCRTPPSRPCAGLAAFDSPLEHTRSDFQNNLKVITKADWPGYKRADCAVTCLSSPQCTRFAYQGHAPKEGLPNNPNICITYSGTKTSGVTDVSHVFDLYVLSKACTAGTL